MPQSNIPLVTPSALQIMSQINGGSILGAKLQPLSALPAAVAVPQPPIIRPQLALSAPAPALAPVPRPAPAPAPGVLGFDYRRISVPRDLQQAHERMARLAGRLGDASRLKLRRPAQAS